MIKTPVRGMRDILPTDMILRSYVLSVIEAHAAQAGFAKIETPAVEHRANLTSKVGGDNEKLIFEILKRGAELESGLEQLKSDPDTLADNASELIDAKELLSDSALRYDLTVPLSRYFAAHQGELGTPFKSLQIGPVWRADAPQKGRYRQFTQCDFDILGDASPLAEIDCILTVGGILEEICTAAGVTGLTIVINDRRLLTALCTAAGFNDSEQSAVLISLDKQDKIGLEGVEAELLAQNFPADAVTPLLQMLASVPTDADFADQLDSLAQLLPDLPAEVIDNLNAIYTAVTTASSLRLVFSPVLVRGMGYYTGSIFEVTANGLGSSIGGGGRYDHMIGRFAGQDVPACGFSIGFERLLTILADQNFQPPASGRKVALLISKKIPASDYARVMRRASELRQNGAIATVLPMAHNLGKQIGRLESAGFTEFEKFYAD